MKRTEEEIEKIKLAIESSNSLSQVIKKLSKVPAGGNYQTLHKFIKDYNIDTSHFTGKLWSKGKIIGPKVPTERYLNNELSTSSYNLKNRLIREKILERKCSNCCGEKWLEHLIPLELDHINGNRHDNNITNLRLLCPNCHALTPTYRGRNKGRYNSHT